jgi:two-component system, NtrC family, sensor kinase
MNLTRKLVLALLAGFLAVLVVGAWLGVRREAALFDSDMRRDHLLLGHALARDLAAVLVAEGEDVAGARAANSAGPRDHVRVRWIALGAPDAPSSPKISPKTTRLSPREQKTLRDGGDVSKRVAGPRGEPDTLYTYVPIPDGSAYALEISESLHDEQQYLRHTMRNAALSTLVLLLLTGVLASLVGRYFVSKPIQAILDKIRNVAAGQLSGDVRLKQRDELGAIASALNEMSAAIARAHEELETETQARIAAVEQLRHADRLMTVGKLASGVAHELGTPLSVIAGRAEMLLLGDGGSEEAKEIARIIRDQTHRMATIIRQLLDFGRKRTPQKNRVEVRTIAERTLALLGHMAETRQVTLALAPRTMETEASVDEGQLQQVLTNLVANAIQATPSGGAVTVDVHRKEARPPVDVGGDPGPYVCVTVADTGCGMAPEVMARIFEPFFTTKEIGEGTGLGLSVAYGIVREHGGWIHVDSGPGKGSKFSVYIPPEETSTS